jgi:hypothetical protein
MAPRSHSYQLLNTNGPIAAQLPHNIMESGVLSVSIVSAMTSEQKKTAAKRYEVHSQLLMESFKWFKANGNHLYNDIDIDTIGFTVAKDSENINLYLIKEDDDTKNDEINESLNRFNIREDDLKDKSQQSEPYLTSRHSVIVNTTPSNFVQVERSTNFLSDFDESFWTKSFAELFPFGRGSYSEPRKVPIFYIFL